MQNEEPNSAIQKGTNAEQGVELTDKKYQTAEKLMQDGSESPTKDENTASKKSMKKSGKVSAEVEGPKNYPLSYMYGLVSALALGASLYFSADLGTRHGGFVGPASFWPGCLLTWVLFHLKDWVWHILGKTPDQNPGAGWCSAKRSMYYELFFLDDDEEEQKEGGNDSSVQKVVPLKKDEESSKPNEADVSKEPVTKLGFSCARFQGSISRGVIELLINVALIYSFMFAEKSGINPGIISSIFSSTCVFTIIMFYFWKKQKLSINDWIGTFFIMLCVVFISIGGGAGDSDDEDLTAASNSTARLLAGAGPSKGPKIKLSKEEANMYLYFSVIAALIAGFILSVNTVSLQYCVNVGCRIDQANFDGNFLMFLIFFPMYLIFEATAPGTYSMRDLFSGSMDIICITIGVIALGKGLACGDGGPMQAIENQKTVVVTIITAIVYEKMPTVLQICGLVSGIIGVLFIVFQNKGKKTEEENAEEKAANDKTAERKGEGKEDSPNFDEPETNQVR